MRRRANLANARKASVTMKPVHLMFQTLRLIMKPNVLENIILRMEIVYSWFHQTTQKDIQTSTIAFGNSMQSDASSMLSAMIFTQDLHVKAEEEM